MRRFLLAGVALAITAGSAHAQIVTDWVLFGETGAQVFTAATTSAPNITGHNLTRGAGITPTVGTNSINSNGWDDLAADDYYTFGFTVANGYSVDMTSLWIATRSSNTGPGFVDLLYSGDGFTTPITTFVMTTTFWTDSIVDLTGLTGLSGNVEFRLKAANGTSANGFTIGATGTFRIGEYYDGVTYFPVAFYGQVNLGGGGAGTPVCFGDGTGLACPCSNNGAAGAGCASRFPGDPSGVLCSSTPTNVGTTLTASGSISLAAQADPTTRLVLTANDTTTQPGLFFSGINTIAGGNGTIFGDGLRCCGGSVKRLQLMDLPSQGAGINCPAVGSSTLDLTNVTPGTVSAGQKICYQYWYRNPGPRSLCGFNQNLSNAVSVTWTP